MQLIERTLCRIGIHHWSQWLITETDLEPVTGHDILDSSDEDFVVETHTRSCERCGRGHIKQLLKW